MMSPDRQSGVEVPDPDQPDRPVAGLRPETVRLLRGMLATTAITDCPIDLTRDEARYILDRTLTPWMVPSSWTRALEAGFRYTVIAAQRARRSGFVDYAEWLEHTRCEALAEILGGLRPEW